jgi:nucleotide-binding universal stress UspA family protein
MTVLLEAADPGGGPWPTLPYGVRRILVAFDGTPGTWLALERAIDLAVSQSALLTIAAVVPDPLLYTGFAPLVLPCSPETLRRDAEREMLRLLAAARDEVPANVSVTTCLLHGRPARRVAALAESGGYDLVLTGPRASSRLHRLLSVCRGRLSRTRTSVPAVRSA